MLIEADAEVAGPALFWDDAFRWFCRQAISIPRRRRSTLRSRVIPGDGVEAVIVTAFEDALPSGRFTIRRRLRQFREP